MHYSDHPMAMTQAVFRLYPIMHWTESYTRFFPSFCQVIQSIVVLKRGRVTTMMTLFDLYLTRNFAVFCVS